MGDRMKQFGDQVKRILKKVLGFKYYLIICAAIVIIIVLIAGVVFIIKKDDAKNKKDDKTNAPNAVEEYNTNVTISQDGKIETSLTAQELWEKMRKNNNRATVYLQSAAQLKKLMDAQLITMYPDTRANPDEEITKEDWEKLLGNVDSKEIQGIVKIKRKGTDGNISTLTYADPDKFDDWIESGDKEALKHFTIDSYDAGSSDSEKDGNGEYVHYDGDAGRIIDAAAKRVGGKYVWGGDTWGSGPSDTAVDCSHFVWHVLKEAGAYKGSYGTSSVWRSRGKKVSSLSEAQAGDVICYSGHVAIYDGNGGIYHAASAKSGIKHSSNANYRQILAIRRFAADGTKVTTNNSDSSTDEQDTISEQFSEGSTSSESTVTSLKDFLVIGDSIAGRLSFKLKDEGATVKYADGMTAKYFVDNFDSVIGSVKETPKGIDIILGQNSCGSESAREEGLKYLKQLVSKLQNKFSNVPIYINSTISISSSGYKGNSKLKASEYQKNQKKLNEEVKSYCESTDNVNYINVLDGYVGNDGYTKANLVKEDGLHPDLNGDGINILINNIKTGITGNSNTESTTETGTGSVSEAESLTNKTKYYVQIATWQEIDTKSTLDGSTTDSSHSYTLSTTNINYQELIQQYQMPFEYLWTFMVLGEDYDILSEIADLVYNSKIEITAFDNLETETVVETETYDKKIKHEEPDSEGNKTVTYTYEPHTKVDTTVTKTNTIDTGVTLADVWYAKYTRDFPDQTSTMESKFGPDSVKDNGDHVNRKFSVTDTVNTLTHTSADPVIKEKTKKKSPNNPNFVSIFCENQNYETRKTIIDGAADWVFEMLEENDSTKELVDLTKYLFYKITGTNYGVTEFNFNSIMTSEMATAEGTGSTSIGGVKGQIANFLLGKGMSIDGVAAVLGNAYAESSFNPKTVSSSGNYIGLWQWGRLYNGSPSRGTELENYAKKKGKNWDDTETQIEFLWKELNGGYKNVKNNLINSKNAEASAEYFARYFERCVNSDGSLQAIGKRKQAAKEWITKLENSVTSGDSTPVNSKGSRAQKLKQLFPSGVPTTESQMSKYITTIQVPITTKSGKKTTMSVSVHKKVANDLKAVCQKAQDSGFRIYSVGGYEFRYKNNGSSKKELSDHAFGTAVDINVTENYSVDGSTVYAGKFWNPSASIYSIPRNGVLVKAFASKGWTWGGSWRSYHDYMHFHLQENKIFYKSKGS